MLGRYTSRYTLGDRVGEGGYSAVYRCKDEVGNRYICKVLSKEKNKRSRVQTEIEAMKKLMGSVRVPRMVDAMENAENYYIVMEWCRGGAAGTYLGTKNTYAENTVASTVRGVLRCLHDVHGAGIIHRDVKVGNVLFSDPAEDAVVKLGDFGLAAFHTGEGTTEINDMVGTPWYMSPEALEKRYGYKSDVWSLGVMTYQLLCGRMPFTDRENPGAPALPKMWYEILYVEPKFKESAWEGVCEEAIDFVRGCLTKGYDERMGVMECLGHPWLTKTDCEERFTGQALACEPFVYEMNAMSIPFVSVLGNSK